MAELRCARCRRAIALLFRCKLAMWRVVWFQVVYSGTSHHLSRT